jgi:hypothetical protein
MEVQLTPLALLCPRVPPITFFGYSKFQLANEIA